MSVVLEFFGSGATADAQPAFTNRLIQRLNGAREANQLLPGEAGRNRFAGELPKAIGLASQTAGGPPAAPRFEVQLVGRHAVPVGEGDAARFAEPLASQRAGVFPE